MGMGAEWQGMGRTLIMVGLAVAGLGVVMLVAPKAPWIGRLPGDVFIQRDRFTFYFPITSCVVASALLSLVFWVIRRMK